MLVSTTKLAHVQDFVTRFLGCAAMDLHQRLVEEVVFPQETTGLSEDDIQVLRALGDYEPGLASLNTLLGHHYAASVNAPGLCHQLGPSYLNAQHVHKLVARWICKRPVHSTH